MTKIYPKLNSLKQKLGIKKINTGKTFTHNSQANGIVFDDIESLHAMGTIDNKVVFKSGLEMTFNQYRGQIEDFGICNANLFRDLNKENIFVEICRTVAFENLLDLHPYIKLIKKVRFMDNDIYINNTAIAQHYELKTPYLDITSNFDIASFFATSKYNPITKKYEPYFHKSILGVIYVYNELHNYTSENMSFEYIGWQGLSRPEEQRASIYHLNNNEDFTFTKGVEKHYFKHSSRVSKKIWNKYNQGKLLFPDDSASDLANECKKITSFTKDEINLAKKRFNQWTDLNLPDEDFLDVIDKLNIEIIKLSLLNWNNLLDISELYWQNKLNAVLINTKSRQSVYV